MGIVVAPAPSGRLRRMEHGDQRGAAHSDASDRIPAAALERLAWYKRQAKKARLGYQYLEFAQLIAGALVPLAVAVHWSTAVAAGLGAAVVVLGGARAIFQWHDNWLAFIDAQIGIEREIALYRIRATPYEAPEAAATLVRKIEQITLDETRRWSSRRRSEAADNTNDTHAPTRSPT